MSSTGDDHKDSQNKKREDSSSRNPRRATKRAKTAKAKETNVLECGALPPHLFTLIFSPPQAQQSAVSPQDQDAGEDKYLIDACTRLNIPEKDRQYLLSMTEDGRKEMVDQLQYVISPTKNNVEEVPLRVKVLQSRLQPVVKQRIMQRLSVPTPGAPDGVDVKYSQWLTCALSVPLGVITQHRSITEDVGGFAVDTLKNLNDAVYGHEVAKRDIVTYITKNLGNRSGGKPPPLLIAGPPGVGKTTLVRVAVANACGSPLVEIPLNAAVDASFLQGSNYVFEGSGPGRIVQAVMVAGCMNPIIFMDELDKVSQTPRGREIVHSLMKIVDPSQNSNFEDVYLNGVSMDLSKCLFIFACNDVTQVDPILIDRLNVIHAKGYTDQEKHVIASTHLAPSLSDDAIMEAIAQSGSELGVRRLKEILAHVTECVDMASQTGPDAWDLFSVPDSVKQAVVMSRENQSAVVFTAEMVRDVLSARNWKQSSNDNISCQQMYM